jgi:hypothetical protein
VSVVRHSAKHRSVREVVQELRLPAPERAAAKAERRVLEALRRERDNEWTPERRAAAVEAEANKYRWTFGG